MNKQKENLPLIIKLLLRFLILEEDFDQYYGDIVEAYNYKREKEGEFRAFLFLLSQIMASIPRFVSSNILWGGIMFTKYLKISYRNMKRNFSHTLINVAGLAAGIASFILIMLWVQDETSYDDFHKNKDDIYRVLYSLKEDGSLGYHSPGPLAAALKEEIPEVMASVRVMPQTGVSEVKYGDNGYYETNVFYTDPSFFDVFSYPLLKGDKTEQLVNPNSIVVSESLANKYFGDEDPIGKTLKVWGYEDFVVSGVMGNRSNSHLKVDILVPLEKLKQWWPGSDEWNNWVDHNTYVLLQKYADVAEAENKIIELVHKHVPNIESIDGYKLQSVKDIHLDTEVSGGNTAPGDRSYVLIFSIVAFIVLLIAGINFMNLSTAASMKRRKEVGLRKVIGSSRTQLIKQYLTESLFLTFLSGLLALCTVYIILPFFNQLIGKELLLNLSDANFYLMVAFIVLTTGLLAGSYPAFYLSSIQPITALKSKGISKIRGLNLRKSLVVIQYTLSIVLIICSGIIYSQIEFMQSTKMGFDKENIIYIEAKGDLSRNYETAQIELMKSPGILNVALKRKPPLEEDWTGSVKWEGSAPEEKIRVETTAVDFNYLELMGFEIAQGRLFSKEHPSDSKEAVVVNETAVKLMGLKNPIGSSIRISGSEPKQIVGIIKDAHVASMKYPIRPQLYYITSDIGEEKMHLWGVILIKINGKDIENSLSSIEAVWDKFNPGYPFDYTFLAEDITKLYRSEKTIGIIFNYFTALAIIISCLGLLGLALLTTEQRTKEIGIRKVNGASVREILMLLNKEYMINVFLSWIIASPIAYFIVDKWLNTFAYKIEISVWVFLLTGLLVLAVALGTVSWQTYKAAKANPIDSLRYE